MSKTTTHIWRLGGTILAALLIFTTITVSQQPAQADGQFVDDDGNVHETAIEAIAAEGITLGCGDGSYCPDGVVTREQIASFLARALDLSFEGSAGFTDTTNSPHATDIDKIAAAGITIGCSADRYCPTQAITRAELATMMTRAFGLPSTSRNYFVDDDGLRAEDNIDSLAEAGITNGCAQGLFCPTQDLTRAEMATILVRAIGLQPVLPAPTPTTLPTTSTTVATPLPPVEAPDNAIYVAPGTDLQGLVNSNPEGTAFLIGAGTHYSQSVSPKRGNQFFGEPGAVLDGQKSKGYAFVCHDGSCTDVVVKGLVITNYATPLEQSTVGGGGSHRWIVEGNEISYSSSGGLTIADGMVVRNNYIHHNDQIGIVSGGGADGALVEDNEIAYNNWQSKFDHHWEAGGTKFLRTNDLIVRNNYVHDNEGPGLWADHLNKNTLYEGNTVVDNSYHGIFHEISYSAVIRNNTVERNGGAGIWIANSHDVEVHNNVVSNNTQFAIAGSVDHRGDGPHGPWIVENLYVHHNTITAPTGWTGIQQQIDDLSIFTSRGNRFESNTYRTAGNSQPFKWMNDRLTRQQWLDYGLDQGATFLD